MTNTLPATQVDVAKMLIGKKNVSLADLMRAVEAFEAQAAGTEPPPSKLIGALPSQIDISEAEMLALRSLPNLASIAVPDTRRELAPQEIQELDNLLDAVKLIKRLIDRLEKNVLKPALFNHFDSIAVQEGRVTAETERTPEGWFVLPDRENGGTETTPNKATREVRSGTANLTAEDLEALVLSGELERDEYLRLTRQTRVVSEPHFLAAFADLVKSTRGAKVVAAVAKATRLGRPSAALQNRKND